MKLEEGLHRGQITNEEHSPAVFAELSASLTHDDGDKLGPLLILAIFC